MLIGYNNDIEHRGVTFHIQTEDRGSTDNKIESQLFHGGAILDTKITSYEEIVEGLEGEQRNKKIKSVMKASHRSLFKNVLAGKYDERVGLEPQEKSTEELQKMYQAKIKEFQPGQDRVPQAAVELEEEGVEALEQEAKMEGWEDPAEQDHMDLSSLKDKLEGVDSESESSDIEEDDIDLGGKSEEEEEPATQIIDPPTDITIETAARSGGSDENAESATQSGGESQQPKVVADTDKLDTIQINPDELDADRLENVELSRDEDEVEVTGGVKAWTGCEEPDEDLSIVSLVEEYMAG